MRRILVAVLVGLVLSLPVKHTAVAHGAAAALQQKRTVYVSVTQKDGAPVTDLTAVDFEVKEGGKPVQVVGAELTKTPIRLTMIVADGGGGGFQIALVTLVQRLQEVAEFSLVSVINQPEKIVDFTTDL